MLTLDEAIAHCKEKAKELKKEVLTFNLDGKLVKIPDYECEECAREHEQLASWLTELKAFREWQSTMKTVYANDSVLVMVKENENGKS